jgi:predicted DNA-binding protein (UPF0251 family)
LIAGVPDVTVFKPRGIPAAQLEAIELGLDELEAIRLADLEGLYHDAASQRMAISRATFGRLVEAARHKVAYALLNSKMLVFKGGPVMVQQQRTFECADCGSRLQAPQEAVPPAECPSCHGKNFHAVTEERGWGRGGGCRFETNPAGGGRRRRLRRGGCGGRSAQ